MVQSFFHIVLFVCLIMSATAQDNGWEKSADSLSNLVSVASSDQEKIDVLHKLSAVLSNHDRLLAVERSEEALSIARLNDDTREIVRSYTNLGKLYLSYGENRKGISYFHKAIKASPSDKPFVGPTWLELGIAYRKMSHTDSAKRSLLKGVEINASRKDHSLEGYLQNELGELAMDAENFATALIHFVKAVESFKKISAESGLTQALMNTGYAHFKSGNYGLALEYTDQSLHNAKHTRDSPREAWAYFQLGNIYVMQRRLDDATKNYDKAISSFQALGDDRKLCEVYLASATTKVEKKEFKSAIDHSRKAIMRARALNEPVKLAHLYDVLLQASYETNDNAQNVVALDSAAYFALVAGLPYVMLDVHDYRSKLFARKGDYEHAYNAMTLYSTLRDSLSAQENRVAARNAETRTKSEKNTGDILVQEASLEVERLRSEKDENQLRYLLALAVLALLLIAVLYNRYTLNLKWKLRLRELDKVKARFYANLSHEFKTPLSLITGPLQRKAAAATTVEEKSEFESMSEKAQRLSIIINQLLDLSKLESGSMNLQVRENDIAQSLRLIATSFASLADHKGIRFRIDIEQYSGPAFFDTDKIERVLTNLLSNAIKFTPAKGTVSFRASVVNQYAVIFVKDTGIGIPQDKVPFIFKRFYQVDDVSTRFQEGSGIGLALCKELTDLHHGTLTVESEVGQGSEFVFTIPISRSAYRKGEVVKGDKKISGPPESTHLKDKALRSSGELPEEGLPLILIAEGNDDMRLYIANTLRLNYRVIGVDDGQDAFNKALEVIPDVIVADVSMQGMDGRMICHNIKTSMATSHIPVVLLTVRADQESKYEGYHIGADDYLTKPFDARELLMRVHNLIQQRKLNQDLFRDRLIYSPEQSDLPLSEHLFYTSLIDTLEKNYSNHLFGVDQLTEHLHLTRMQLHRKLKSLTNKSAGDFLRQFRLERAKQLLTEGLTISEIAFKTGFHHHATFSKAFREFTGGTPTEFVSKSRAESSKH